MLAVDAVPPIDHEYAAMLPSESELPVPSKLQLKLVQFDVKEAVGATFTGGAVTVTA